MLSLIDIDLSDFDYKFVDIRKMSNAIYKIDNEASLFVESITEDIDIELSPSKDSPHHYYNRGKRVNHFELVYNLKKLRLFIIQNTSGVMKKTMLDTFNIFAFNQLVEHKKENL
jgi:hypothetical protein